MKLFRKKKEPLTPREQYMEDIRVLPLREHDVLLESKNGKELGGNIYRILEHLMTDSAFQSHRFFLTYEDEEKKKAIEAGTRDFGDDRLQMVMIDSTDYFKALACCKYIICDATLKNYFIKRPGQVYLNVWHGTPLKTMGRRVAHEPHATGNAQKNFVMADYLLYPNEYMREHMIEDYMIGGLGRGTILMGGYPRNSIFFDEEKRRILRQKEALTDKKVYVYMPTWRPSMMGRDLQKILEAIDGKLADDEILYAKAHPLAEEDLDLSGLRRVRPFPKNYETYEFLNGADGLLTDYSSVFYDYAVSGRSIVLYTYDEEEYLKTRGLYEPLDSLPFPKTKDLNEAIKLLREKQNCDYPDFRRRFCAYEGIDAAAKLCRRVILGEEGGFEEGSFTAFREKILVYAGDLQIGEERTEELMAFLEAISKEKDVYLTFHRKDLADHYQILNRLPSGVQFFGCAGKMVLRAEEKKLREAFRKGKISFPQYRDGMREAYTYEAARNYGGASFDKVVIFRAPDRKWLLEFGAMDAVRILYLNPEAAESLPQGFDPGAGFDEIAGSVDNLLQMC